MKKRRDGKQQAGRLRSQQMLDVYVFGALLVGASEKT
jgi:hypothetical protein